MLYSEAALELLGGVTEEQIITILVEAIASSNLALSDSGIPMVLELVSVQEVRSDGRGCRVTSIEELQRFLGSQIFNSSLMCWSCLSWYFSYEVPSHSSE